MGAFIIRVLRLGSVPRMFGTSHFNNVRDANRFGGPSVFGKCLLLGSFVPGKDVTT